MDFLEHLANDNSNHEPTAVEAVIGLGMVLNERLAEINAALERIAGQFAAANGRPHDLPTTPKLNRPRSPSSPTNPSPTSARPAAAP